MTRCHRLLLDLRWLWLSTVLSKMIDCTSLYHRFLFVCYKHNWIMVTVGAMNLLQIQIIFLVSRNWLMDYFISQCLFPHFQLFMIFFFQLCFCNYTFRLKLVQSSYFLMLCKVGVWVVSPVQRFLSFSKSSMKLQAFCM